MSPRQAFVGRDHFWHIIGPLKFFGPAEEKS